METFLVWVGVASCVYLGLGVLATAYIMWDCREQLKRGDLFFRVVAPFMTLWVWPFMLWVGSNETRRERVVDWEPWDIGN